MQSGITASAELHNAFTKFTSDDAQFCLPITITSESLTPLPSIAFSSSTFSKALSSLDSLLTPTIPLYLLLRKAPSQRELIAVTYIPSRAPVRQKTLFASTRATLIRELGSEKFAETVFLTEREEILDPAQWDERAGTSTTTSTAGSHAHTGLLSTEERELQAVKRAEEEERHGTRGRDLMGQGGSGAQYASGGAGGAGKGIQMKVTDDAKSAIAGLASAGAGTVVQLGIEISTETLTLSDSKAGVSAGAVVGLIPSDRPSYTFYSVENGAVFIYVCPGTSKVKERMVYASSRRGLLHVAEMEGVKVLKRLEAGGPDELGGGRIEDEVKSLAGDGGLGAEGDGDAESAPASGTATPRGAFARPKRPGRR
ncbi:PTK9 protein tyrosine kinase 9 [Exophiala viscosa]|uniref:PTK9 protein tyrosine kinase 9 n=1 Tax=Exophiala viscosa TaxID=2486360 RepID=UPI00219419B9|nr:PTK9 protein tyrosine kinase 9 [Exophiala viscosa]